MLIWLLLVTAIPHYYYSLQALNHSDGYNLTSINFRQIDSSPLHFFNTNDKVGRFSNWLCNFLFSSTPSSMGDAEKAPFKRLLCGEIHWLVPVWPQSSAEWPWLCCVLECQLPGLVVGQSFIFLSVIKPSPAGSDCSPTALHSCKFRYGLNVGTLVPWLSPDSPQLQLWKALGGFILSSPALPSSPWRNNSPPLSLLLFLH